MMTIGDLPDTYGCDYKLAMAIVYIISNIMQVDQNEKIAMFGVTHVCAIDGYSRMIVGFSTMSVKNNVEIYRNLYRFVKLYMHYA